ncbi:Dihydroxy-acid dehydratase [Thioalkalivibrio nitratireducens DSM 14787]|uniref:Dihydroxy-acid dehydratase n=1 Tax=Thioalkalivibrio nitratireducens (strain DSM 14787 / UNIQEM 213 / ALEN2) TaxID=1255043 RepID=L0E1N4_THIND|nr:Dihydroxy-acid dehydratase [Thioalkalivibrio nitratireducens DSM 14787]
MDTPLLIIGALLVATLIAFFTGVLPYPIGWIILTVAFIGRLIVLMSSAFEAMGMSLPGSSTQAAEDPEKIESAAHSAEVLLEAIHANRRPRDIMTREAFENALAVVMALGGSTNAVLHLLAIAHSARVHLDIDDVERIRRKVPVLCDLKPSGQYVTTRFHAVGGTPHVMKM